jgi:hypothetical protein
MEFKLNFKMDNAAFEDNPEEVQTILKNIGFDISKGYGQGMLRDSNGNMIGEWKITGGAK